jgi:molybdopterin converting factor subunit 1
MRVKFFAHLQGFAGCDETEIPVSSEMTQEDFWQALEQKFPGILRYKNTTRLARNFAYTEQGTTFREGDEIALIPPVSGG